MDQTSVGSWDAVAQVASRAATGGTSSKLTATPTSCEGQQQVLPASSRQQQQQRNKREQQGQLHSHASMPLPT